MGKGMCDCLGHEVIDGKLYGRVFHFDSRGNCSYGRRDCPNPDSELFKKLLDEQKRHRELLKRNYDERLVESVDANWYDEYKKEWKTPKDWCDGRGIMTEKERFKLWLGEGNWSNCKKCIKYVTCHLYLRDDTHMCPYYDDGVDPEIKMIINRLTVD